MKTISVLEYSKNPDLHQVPGKTEVPKPTIFKQIKENRLPSNVRAVSIGGRYVMEVYEPGELLPEKKIGKKAAEGILTELKASKIMGLPNDGFKEGFNAAMDKAISILKLYQDGRGLFQYD